MRLWSEGNLTGLVTQEMKGVLAKGGGGEKEEERKEGVELR